MFVKWIAWLPRLRRWLSRREWAVRLLRLSRPQQGDDSPGLVLIQIDGLSRTQFERAVADGRMPFLRRLIRREHYQLHTLYSGLPSSTPSVQGELFYGVRCAVPAFGFRSSESGREVMMVSPAESGRVEAWLSEQATGLLSGGSAYGNIYSGGAAETHFCARNLGWGGLFSQATPWRLMIVLFWHLGSLLRALGLMLVELVLAPVDLFRGAFEGRSFMRELQFIPARIGVVVLMREFVAIGACIDITRGVPVVHLNLLGYDEQAHRRGPESAFAHWSLHGIDKTIRRVWKAAHSATARHYDVWIYSDHGQESTTPYQRKFGRTIQGAVAEIARGFSQAPLARSLPDEPAHPAERAMWLGEGRLAKTLVRAGVRENQREMPPPLVVANGPVGFVYLGDTLNNSEQAEFAKKLVTEAGCPMVYHPQHNGTAHVFTPRGTFSLPRDSIEVFGQSHPFREEVAVDMLQLCHHKEAGELTICGWRIDGGSLSFPMQNGAHAGPGREETRALLLLPPGSPLATSTKNYFRPDDVRRGALRKLKRLPRLVETPETETKSEPLSIRVMTYNVHGCVGMDGQHSPTRIASVIAQSQADVIALQEIDVVRSRSGGVDQAKGIAQQLNMQYHFHPAWTLEQERYGDAIMSRLPIGVRRAEALPGTPSRRAEPRGALWVELNVGEQAIQIINTHLGIMPTDQQVALDCLLGKEWLEQACECGPVILCGDFNFGPSTRRYRQVVARLVDAQASLHSHNPRATYVSWKPIVRIDHVFISSDLEVSELQVCQTQLARMASDHLPLLAGIRLPGNRQ